MNQKKISRGLRIASMAIDHVIISIIVMIITLPIMLGKLSGSFEISHYTNHNSIDYGNAIYFMIFAMAIYICKDCINGRSIAKRILGHEVIDRKTKLVADPLKCLVRNLFIIIWPVEVIMVLINPSRRLGDKVAGTEVVYFDKEKGRPKLNFPKLFLAIIIAYGFLFVILLPIINLSKNNVQTSEKIDEAFYNKSLTDSLNKRFNDSLHTYMSADIRIYNKTSTNNKMYISAIFNLKEDYELDDEEYENMKNFCYQLFTISTEKPFTGRMQFVYKHGAKLNIRETKMEN